jgi:hypothetical protein
MSASSLAEPAAAGHPVAVDRIESFLRETWDASETSCRASLYNLVLYTQDVASVESNTEILATIAQNHACRALLVCAPSGDDGREVRAWVTAHCSFDRTSGPRQHRLSPPSLRPARRLLVAGRPQRATHFAALQTHRPLPLRQLDLDRFAWMRAPPPRTSPQTPETVHSP